jgi:hypothetical protein
MNKPLPYSNWILIYDLTERTLFRGTLWEKKYCWYHRTSISWHDLEMPKFARNNDVSFCVHILILPSICYSLTGHFQALEKSIAILVSLWTVAAWIWNNFIQTLYLMRTLQTFGKSWKTGEIYKQVTKSLEIPNTDYLDYSFIYHSYIMLDFKHSPSSECCMLPSG